jgi:hypothetical protein
MPRVAKSYNNTIIYKIVCKDSAVTDLYVGHTTDFRQRLKRHREDCIKHPERKLYNMINNNGGWDNWDMLIIETCSFNNVEEAKQREHYWYENLKANLNHNMPLIFGLTKEAVEEECNRINGGIAMFKRLKFLEIIKRQEEEIENLKEEIARLRNQIPCGI